jgi:hypothetical protein
MDTDMDPDLDSEIDTNMIRTIGINMDIRQRSIHR